MTERFVVRELEGWKINPRASSAGRRAGVTIWIADELLDGREVRLWRTEDHRRHRGAYSSRRARLRADAQQLADQLNAEEA